MIVPIEYRDAGAPPATWFIDDLMRFLQRPYYVGLLTAAGLHGAGHQQPMLFQVVTDRPLRPARAGRARISFHAARNLDRIPVEVKQTEAGSMRVSTPDATAFDLVRFTTAAGYLNNVATVLGELAEKLSAERLTKLAEQHAVADVQRLGRLLEFLGHGEKAAGLSDWLAGHRVRPVLLALGRASGNAAPDPRWQVIQNAEIEADN